MEEINFSNQIPDPPEDLLQWLKSKGCFSQNWLIYQCGWETEIMTGIKSKCLDVECTACGKHFKAERNEDIDMGGCGCGYPTSYYSQYQGYALGSVIKDHEKTKCPLCGAEVECMHVHRVGHEEMGTEWPLVISRVGGNVIIAAYRVMRKVDKQGISEYSIQKYEAYVFTPKKTYRLAGWVPCMYSGRYLINQWEQRKRCTDQYGKGALIYPAARNVFKGTRLENCKFYRYIRNSGKECLPISYLLFYKKHPQIENLLVQGFGQIVTEAVDSSFEEYGSGFDEDAVNWKEVAPRKMLGLSKPDFVFLRGKRAASKDITDFRKLRQINPSMDAEEILNIVRTFGYNVKYLAAHGKSAGKIARYCVKQVGKCTKREKQTPSGIFSTWEDYIEMAKKLGYDLKDDSVRFPSKLQNAHDRAVMATKYKESQELIEKFKAMYERLLPFSFEKDGLFIRPAASETELIKEGKVLQHCVGGYGKTHCGGKTIFFIRKAAEPDIPYYTLNLDLERKYIIQIHGYRNDALKPVPAEVTEFSKYWLENVVKVKSKGNAKKNSTSELRKAG